MGRIVPATDSAIAEAAATLQNGGLVAIPTETVYGLAADALNADAVAKIFSAKGRPATNPLIVHIAAPEDAAVYAKMDPQQEAVFHTLTKQFWPGPLTLVVPRKPCIPDNVTAGGETVALRMPRHPVALALLHATGTPLAAPSANRSEQLSPTRAEHVVNALGDAVDMVLDGGPCEVGLESTVLDITAWPPRLLRPGTITLAELETFLGASLAQGGADALARAPGQMPRHYAPRTPLRLVADAWQEAAATPNAALIAYTPPDAPPPSSLRAAAVLPPDPHRYAAILYDTLHRLDSLSPSIIFVQEVPATDEWLAVQDRLKRAAE